MNLRRVILSSLMALSVMAGYAVEQAPTITKSEVIVFINGQKFYVHTVKAGETLYSIGKAYDVAEDVIKSNNPRVADGLKIDQTLKIPLTEKERDVKKRKKEFVVHKIKAGETLYAIARQYNIAVSVLREDNPDINPQALAIGQAVWVRRAQMGESSAEEAHVEMQEYAENLNKAAGDGYQYHVVQAGETIYSLARKYGITEKEFAELNDISMGLKAGAVVRVPQSQEDNLALIDSANSKVDNAVINAQGSDENIIFRALASEQELNIALMLPLNVGGKPNASYVEFYQGFLLGLEDVKQRYNGKTSLTLYNTEHDSIRVENIVKSQLFEATNLIVGPVYEDELKPVLTYAAEHSVPVVSPLANIELQHSALYQLAPAAEHKYDKVAELINGDKEICLIYTDSNDKEFEAEIMKLLEGKSYNSYTYTFDKESIFTPRTETTRQLEETIDILNTDKEILFIVFANRETDVDRILGTFASSKVSNTERSIKVARYSVLGTSRWGRFANIDLTTLFNNNVMMISTYHAKRDSEVVRAFDSRYIKAYNALPSLYAYRGYDSAVIFGGGMRSDIEYNMLDKRYMPLQTGYKFEQASEGGKYVNREWVLVKYNNNHTITIH